MEHIIGSMWKHHLLYDGGEEGSFHVSMLACYAVSLFGEITCNANVI